MCFTDLLIKWNPWLGDYRPQIPIPSAPGTQMNFLNLPEQNSLVRHC
jgi:hypothetical protein